ncbi:hypothetical protein BpHYR1_011321 [Brachionus plicatilis]|uniref:Uncharacterized protein n=1 Tax=Brachionus plicatilis TaxID=10195 RepID=A0A3M7Q1C5_BRAPC|nr:hypothetical protein BpHYR1_011321 [Brachionus plicatilis]
MNLKFLFYGFILLQLVFLSKSDNQKEKNEKKELKQLDPKGVSSSKDFKANDNNSQIDLQNNANLPKKPYGQNQKRFKERETQKGVKRKGTKKKSKLKRKQKKIRKGGKKDHKKRPKPNQKKIRQRRPLVG